RPLNAESLQRWPQWFGALPPWDRIADSLAESRDDDDEGNRDRLRLAELAASIAAQSGWCSFDAAFWLAMGLTQLPLATSTSRLAELSGPERSVAVAGWFLSESHSQAFTIPQGLRGDQLANLLQVWDATVDWSSIDAEARHVALQPVEIEQI